jgi:hypothetical protein
MTEDELNDRIRALCEERGLKFKPWEFPPWEVSEQPNPYPPGMGSHTLWPQALALRRKLIAEIEDEQN